MRAILASLLIVVALFFASVSPTAAAPADDAELILPLARQGDPWAQDTLGTMYGAGKGVPQDNVEAAKWYRLAAEQGDAEAQVNLGVMYDNGHGVAQDFAEAAKWYGKAADQGNATAKLRLAEIQIEAEPLRPLGRRVALVIGNSKYANLRRLPNAGDDATDVSAALERIGFEVTQVQNADYGQMRASLQQFSAEADGADMALVYYAGHGFEVENKNYLVPIDARLKSDRDIDFETIPLAVVEGSVSGAKTLSMVILDACRDNPFAVEMALSSPTRSIGRGLSAVEPSGGVLIAYSAKGGSIATDGTGRNSPFASAFNCDPGGWNWPSHFGPGQLHPHCRGAGARMAGRWWCDCGVSGGEPQRR